MTNLARILKVISCNWATNSIDNQWKRGTDSFFMPTN